MTDHLIRSPNQEILALKDKTHSEFFTPRDWYSDERLRIPKDDIEVVWGDLRRGTGIHAEIVWKGKRYEIHGAACSIPKCQCDARIKEVKREWAGKASSQN